MGAAGGVVEELPLSRFVEARHALAALQGGELAARFAADALAMLGAFALFGRLGGRFGGCRAALAEFQFALGEGLLRCRLRRCGCSAAFAFGGWGRRAAHRADDLDVAACRRGVGVMHAAVLVLPAVDLCHRRMGEGDGGKGGEQRRAAQEEGAVLGHGA